MNVLLNYNTSFSSLFIEQRHRIYFIRKLFSYLKNETLLMIFNDCSYIAKKIKNLLKKLPRNMLLLKVCKHFHKNIDKKS